MMKKKMTFLTILTLIFALLIAGCGTGGDTGGDTTTPGDGGGATTGSIIIATGGTSGTYYPLGGGMAQIFIDQAGINASAQTTGASAENMRLLKNGEVDLAFTQSDIADYASKGTVMFETDGAIENIQAIASLYSETVQIIVAADSPIQSVEDLKGMRVSVGAPGSGTEANAMQILEMYGMSFDDLGRVDRLAFGESASFLQDGTLDAAFVTAGTPTAAVNELAATKGVRVIGMGDEQVSSIVEKYPYYTEEVIPAGTYAGFDQEVKTVAVKAQLVVRAELDEESVYNMTKALFENLTQLGNVHEKGTHISLETALEGVSLELHPGAARYFNENGITN